MPPTPPRQYSFRQLRNKSTASLISQIQKLGDCRAAELVITPRNVNGLHKYYTTPLTNRLGTIRWIGSPRKALLGSPLMVAAMAGKIDMCRRLIENGANLNDCDSDESTICMRLVEKPSAKSNAILKLLLQAGADPNLPNNNILQRAIEIGDLYLVQLFLDNGAKVNGNYYCGFNALMRAACLLVNKDSVKIIQALLRKCTPEIVNHKSLFGYTALALLVNKMYMFNDSTEFDTICECMQLLIAAGANVNIICGTSTTRYYGILGDVIINTSGNAKQPALVKMLLDAGADPTIHGDDFPPIILAAKQGQSAMATVKLLLRALQFKIDTCISDHINHLEYVLLMINCGMDLSSSLDKELTVLAMQIRRLI